MGAIISSNTLRLEPDSISYQTGKVQIPEAPSDANTMIFYYKAYFDTTPEIGNAITTEDGTSYAWNNDSFFGLSFSGTVSANVGGIVGFTNGTENNVFRAENPSNRHFNRNSNYTSVIPCGFQNAVGRFYFGSTVNGYLEGSGEGFGYYGSYICPSTQRIGLSGAKTYLGFIQIAKNSSDPQRVVISYGNNWENLSNSNFSTAISSISSNWSFKYSSQIETINFRPNHANPALANTINFPRWIVTKWPSAVLGRNFVVTDIKVEYYS